MPDFSAATSDLAGPTPGVLLRVKVVPGASRSRVMGLLGDRLKVAVAAPPEDGKANRAVCELLAGQLGVGVRSVTVTAGHTQPQKTLAIMGMTRAAVLARLSNA